MILTKLNTVINFQLNRIIVFQYHQPNMLNHISQYTKMTQPYVRNALYYAGEAQDMIQQKIYQQWPDSQHLNRFQIFLILNALIFGLFVLFKVLSFLNPFSLYNRIIKASFQLPMVKQKIKAQIQKSKKQFLSTYPAKHRAQLKKIPYNPIQPSFGTECQMQSVKGYLSGSRYPDKKHSDFVVNLAKQFSYSNPLHFDLHPHVKQMEVQVIRMCARMLNFYSDKIVEQVKQQKDKNKKQKQNKQTKEQKRQVVGGFFSGGTQSILMAILAYRQYGYKYKNVKIPNLVICTTGHAAALKAADLFGIEVRFVKTNKNQEMDISDMKSKIDCNTVCVYTSYPNYPYGTVDPIQGIAYICRKKSVPVHIDMCLGGFVVPFLKKQDGSPYFDVPRGVTSISLDCHKYGLSAKGASVLLFSSQKYRKQQMFVTSQWPGGFYGTIGIAGSRSGATVASAWVSMMRLGQKGYTKNAVAISNAVKRLAQQLKSLGFKVFGKPEICCIGFSHPKFNVGQLKQAMKKKGWDLPVIQKPMAIHYSFTPINCGKVDQIVADFKSVLAQLQSKPRQKKVHKGSQLEIYGICSKIPDVGAKKIIVKGLIDCFLQV